MVYISIDIETDGPVPGLFSMRALGAVAYTDKGAELGRFYYKLQPAFGANPLGEEETMRWWKRFPEQWEELQMDARPPAQVMEEFVTWLKPWPGATAICWPTAWDFGWVYYYLIRYVGICPLGHTAICIKTLAGALTGNLTRSASKRDLPEGLTPPERHTHVAVEDAAEQGELFFMLKRELERRRGA